jgi:PAS domain S-box-containing protein
MTATTEFVSLPPLRRKVFGNSLFLLALFIGVGIVMMIAVVLASGVTPRLIHLNYDSIQAAAQMDRAWVALHHLPEYPQKSAEQWTAQFERAITFEEGNVTEPGEKEIAQDLRKRWNAAKSSSFAADRAGYSGMETSLDRLVEVNESGMFRLAEASTTLSHQVLIGSIVIFVLTIFVAFYLADALAVRIADPLKQLAETLRRKPMPGSKLKLPKPTNVEMRILTHEMSLLWERLSTLQKLNLEELATQGRKLEEVLAAVDDAILVLDNDERVLHCNEGMLKLLSLKTVDVQGREWRDLPSMGDNYMRLRGLLTSELSRDQNATVELEAGGQAGGQASGRKRVYSGRCRPFFGDGGAPIGTLYLLHDITEIRQRDRLKTEFIGVLSHELKTPLQSLGTASELLYARREKIVDEEERMLVETLHEDVGRIRAVANEFVQVGLVDLHSLRLRIAQVPINELIQQWIQPFQVLGRDKGVKVEFVKEGSDRIFAQIDVVKFPWAISNLLSNAIRVSPPGSVVTVHLTDRERSVDIEVRDEGPGIPDDIRERVFDPYFQGESAAPGAKGFLGLGLTITKEVVEAHDGKIEYFPRLPHGSVFRISLPMPS